MTDQEVEDLAHKYDQATNDVVFLAAQVERHRGQIVRLLDLFETVRTGFDAVAAELDA